jgi:hypothetical protein
VHLVHAVLEDHVKPELLFAGTEFGVFFSVDSGQHWVKLAAGVPTIAVFDLAIQRRENDLVLGTFGRGFYVLDDYTPLRTVSAELLRREAVLFPVRAALQYIPASRLGGRSGRGSQGAGYFAAPNPPLGALVTYYLREGLLTRAERRREAEKKAAKAGEKAPYPTVAALREEDEEIAPVVYLEVRDEAGEVVRRIPAPGKKGFHRVAWDLRYPSAAPVRLREGEEPAPWEERDVGPMVMPGKYRVELVQKVGDEPRVLAGPETIAVVPLALATHHAADRAAVLAFQREVEALRRAVEGAVRVVGETASRLEHLRQAILDTPRADPALFAALGGLERRLAALRTELSGDRTISSREGPAPIALAERVSTIVNNQWRTTAAPTQTERDGYRMAGEAFTRVLGDLRQLVGTDLRALEARLELAGAPWTPGRLPEWKMR